MIPNGTGRTRSIPYGCLKWFSTAMLIMADQVEPQTINYLYPLLKKPTNKNKKPQPTVQLSLVMLERLHFQWKIQRNSCLYSYSPGSSPAYRFILSQLISTETSLRKSYFLWLLNEEQLIQNNNSNSLKIFGRAEASLCCTIGCPHVKYSYVFPSSEIQ